MVVHCLVNSLVSLSGRTLLGLVCRPEWATPSFTTWSLILEFQFSLRLPLEALGESKTASSQSCCPVLVYSDKAQSSDCVTTGLAKGASIRRSRGPFSRNRTSYGMVTREEERSAVPLIEAK